MQTADLDFFLPPELIAQEPPAERTASRLLHYRRSDLIISHLSFANLPQLLRRGDLLVFNNTRVLPARFLIRKPTGGIIEALFLAEERPQEWRVLLKNAGNLGPGAELKFAGDRDVRATLLKSFGSGEWMMAVSTDQRPAEILQRLGRMPMPPYIRRDRDADPRDALDRERYQTTFANSPGAVAAPTAALHFSNDLLNTLAANGVELAFITLHVGLGTFKPVMAERLELHSMHSESYVIDAKAAEALNRAKAEARRIIAVGTTSARVLESHPESEPFAPRSDTTNILIYPPYRWKHVAALITNFHLPRSTLIALVAALVGQQEQRRIYQTAIEEKYRFFSYGDAMLIE